MNILNKFSLLLIVSLSCCISCKEEEEQAALVSGEIINAFTQEPVADATVTLLEGGSTITTGADGYFEFSNDLIGGAEEANIQFAVALSHQGYHPREANVERGTSMRIELAPRDVPVYFYFPPVQLDDGIATGELREVGMDRQIIQNMMDHLYNDGYNEVHSILVYKDGKLVLEEYMFGNNDTIQFENDIKVDKSPAPIQWSRTEEHYVASVNKALTSTVVGIAMDQYDVSVDARISDFLPEYSSYFADEQKGALTFEDCLTMIAGFQWDEWGSNDLALLWKSEDFAEYVLSRNNKGPGTEWVYNSALPNLLLKSLDNMVDGEVREWAHANFYAKLGITDYRWQSQPDGYPEGAARMYIRPRDMLKVGITYLNDGKWNGEQVVPASWVRECFEVKEETASGDYSYYFWLREIDGRKYLSADGDGGNYINIFPEDNMVIVFTQGLYLRWPSYVTQAEDMMAEYILPSMKD